MDRQINRKSLTYFDNSATSFPKPEQVALAMVQYLTEVGGNYGRSAHSRAFESSSVVEECREKLAEIMGIERVENLCFANNATHAANVIIQGLTFPKGAEVLISPMEHNAIARPLKYLEDLGHISIKVLAAEADGLVSVGKIQEQLTPDTRLVVINHQSNVNGIIQPLQAIKTQLNDIPLMVDVSQSLGKYPVCVDHWDIDYLVFTGHKGLLGPTGTGGFYIRHPKTVTPLHFGGTGSNSEHLSMPTVMPDRFEAGTPNIAGIYGLLAALEHSPEPCHTCEDFQRLMASIHEIDGYQIQQTLHSEHQGEVISLIHATIDCGTLSWLLEKQFKIDTRSGLHCAPLAHQHLGSYPDGTCRISTSPMHTTDDFQYLLNALKSISREHAS